MKKQNIFILIAVIILIGVFVYNIIPGKEERKASDSFAQCLTEKGMKMYGTEWCSHCKEQKAKLGEAFRYVEYIDCDEDKQACNSEGISGYPTWKINGQSFPGTKSLEQLAQLSKCELQLQ